MLTSYTSYTYIHIHFWKIDTFRCDYCCLHEIVFQNVWRWRLLYSGECTVNKRFALRYWYDKDKLHGHLITEHTQLFPVPDSCSGGKLSSILLHANFHDLSSIDEHLHRNSGLLEQLLNVFDFWGIFWELVHVRNTNFSWIVNLTISRVIAEYLTKLLEIQSTHC